MVETTTIQLFETTTLEQPKVRSNEHFTPERIEWHCQKIADRCLVYKSDDDLLALDSLQIIRQLQEENAELSEIVRVFQET